MAKYPENIEGLIEERVGVFRDTNSITNRNSLLESGDYPLANNQWLKIPDVVCVFVDIRNSTGLSATTHDQTTASIYELFTGTAVHMFHKLGAGYIDIKGDGVFALFNANQAHRALVAAISFKTFVQGKFFPLVGKKLNGAVDVGVHMGIDQKTVLVKQLGIRDAEGRDRRKNEVWAGKPINMAAKLAARSGDDELLVSDRFYNHLAKSDYVQRTCGCVVLNAEAHEIADVWQPRDVSEEKVFDFNTAYSMRNCWCATHGKEWSDNILALDD